ncbi:MAG: Lin0512 family protein [Geobacteraceae bacterium]|nr:Lin0512 family protein [Geobacteraceae bacterium]
MPVKRFVVELGYGADLHGANATKAAKRAVKDAVSRSCLCGLFDIVGIHDPNEMHVKVKIACPKPQEVNGKEVLEVIPFGSKELEVVEGGLLTQGLEVPALGSGDNILVAVASLTVCVNIEESGKL